MPGSEIKWRVPGHWTVVQSNGLRVRFEITQDGNTVVGTAYRSPDPGSRQPKVHEVQSGDTLSAIAKQHYGDANAYRKIFEANQPMLKDADDI